MTSYIPMAAGSTPDRARLKTVILPQGLPEYYRKIERENISPDNLNSFTISYVDMSIEAAVELGFTLGSVRGASSKRVVVYECQRYTNVGSDDGSVTLRVGSSARCVFTVSIKKINVNISSSPFLAMSCQLGYSDTTVEVTGLGIRPGPLLDALPKFTNLDMTSYVKLEHAFTEALPSLMQDKNQLQPQVLGAYGNFSDSDTRNDGYRTALATSYALTEIAKGVEIQRQDPGRLESESFKQIVRDVYMDFGLNGDDKVPSDRQIAEARDLLRTPNASYETERKD